MRHPTTHTFLKWAGPTVVAFCGGCVGLIAALASSFPRVRPWAEREFDLWWPVVSAPLFMVLSLVVICAYIAALVYTGQAVPAPKTGLSGLKPMTRRERRADDAFRKKIAAASPEEAKVLLRDEMVRIRQPKRSWIARLLGKLKGDATAAPSPITEEDTYRKAFNEITNDRMPYVGLRDLAADYGIKFQRFGPRQNEPYELEGALKEAAANGLMSVWGRPYQGKVRDNDPLIPIPAEHFRTYSFRHGALEAGYPNDQTCTTTLSMLAWGKAGREGVTFYDLYLSTKGARAVLRAFKESRNGD